MSDIVLILKHAEVIFLLVVTCRFPACTADIPMILSSNVLDRSSSRPDEIDRWYVPGLACALVLACRKLSQLHMRSGWQTVPSE
jgi:hypothetical protein